VLHILSVSWAFEFLEKQNRVFMRKPGNVKTGHLITLEIAGFEARRKAAKTPPSTQPIHDTFTCRNEELRSRHNFSKKPGKAPKIRCLSAFSRRLRTDPRTAPP